MVTVIIEIVPRLRVGLDPELVTQGSIYGDRPGAIHKPDSSEALEQSYQPATGAPSRQSRRNFEQINQGQANENDHPREISGVATHICSEHRDEYISDRHPAVRRGT